MKNSKKPKYRKQLIAVFSTIAIIILITGYIYLDNQRQKIRLEKEKYLLSIAENKAKLIERWYNEIELFSKTITKSVLSYSHVVNVIKNFPSEKDNKLVSELFQAAKIHFTFKAIVICNNKEEIVFSSSEQKALFSDEVKKFCRIASEQKEFIFSNFYKNTITQKPQLSFHIPIFENSEDQKFVGALNIIIDPQDYLYPEILEWPVASNSGECFLSKYEDVRVQYLSPLRFNRNAVLDFTLPDSIKDLPAYLGKFRFSGITEGRDYRNQEVLAAVKNIGKTNWSLIAKEDQDEIFHESDKNIIYLAILIVGGIPIFGLVFGFIWTRKDKELLQKMIVVEREASTAATQLSNITQNANDAIFLVAKNGIILQANKKATTFYGYTNKEFEGMELSKIIADSEKPAMKKRIEKILVSPEGMLIESYHQRKNGLVFPVEVSAKKVEVENQIFIQAIVRDITERKNADEKVYKSEQKLRTIFSAMDDMVLVVNKDGMVIEVAPTNVRSFNMADEEVLNRSISEFITADCSKKLFETIKEILRTKNSIQLRCRTKKEIVDRWFDTRISPMNESSVIMVIRDITEQKKVEREKELLQNISLEVSQSQNFNAAVSAVLKNICETTGWICGEAWAPDNDKAKLIYLPVHYCANEEVEKFRDKSFNYQFEKGKGLPGRVWEAKSVNWIRDISADSNFPRTKIASLSSINAGVCFPILADEEVVAIICFYFQTIKEEDKDFERLVSSILYQLSELFKKKKSEENDKLNTHILNEIGEAVIKIDLEGRIKYWNIAAEKIYGWKSSEVSGKKFIEVINLSSTSKVTTELMNSITEGKNWFGELTANHKNGKSFPALLASSPFFGETGKLQGTITVSRNITEIKEKEILIRKLSLGIEQNSASVVITDPDGRIEYVNPHFTKITGYTFQEAIGKNPRILKSGKTPPEVYTELWNTILSGNVWRGEFLNKKKNGELFWEAISISPMKNDNNEIINFIAIKEDVTEKKKLIEDLVSAKEKAEEMNRVKSFFFANMSHELRTPLIGILGFSEMLKENLTEDEETQNMAGIIFNGGQRLLSTLNLILNLSKLDANLMEIKLVETDINPLIKKIFETYISVAKRTNLNYNLSLESTPINCLVDRHFINHIFDNLINNAIKFTASGGIEIQTAIKENHAIVIVRDTGIGIPKDMQEIIWEEFRQASEGLNRSFEGTGLGLTIAKKYTEAMGGNISLESEEGKGTTFIIQLPLATEKLVETIPIDENTSEKYETKNSKSETGSVIAKNILLVEDDDISIDLVKRILPSIYKLDVALSGEEALKKASAFKYDAILMDINLRRGIDGIQVTEALRKNEQYKSIPIIALTAYAMREERDEFLSKGMTHYLSKPFSRKELLNLMELVFKEK